MTAKNFKFRGIVYSSLTEFCRKNAISYSKAIRLCRTFRRAKKDPVVACKWLLGLEILDTKKEPRTVEAFRDAKLCAARCVLRDAKKRVKHLKQQARLIR